jgi:hypothetical protein
MLCVLVRYFQYTQKFFTKCCLRVNNYKYGDDTKFEVISDTFNMIRYELITFTNISALLNITISSGKN